MIAVETAIRAWVKPDKKHKKRTKHAKRAKPETPWRPQPYGERVLVFDTETTTDHAQRLLFAFFRIYERDKLVLEGIIAADVLDHQAMEAISTYAARHRLPIYSRERFVEEVFYPEVYELGTLCVGFNLPFDLARIALRAGCGRGKNRRKFRLMLSRRLKWHDMRIEAASGHASFIGFVPKRKLSRFEKPFFTGRFLDASVMFRALTGKSATLDKAARVFKTHTRKMGVDELGRVTRETLTYGRQDVRVTWALFRKLREEYAKHTGFETFANEREKPKMGLYMSEIYSSASVAKQYLRLCGCRPLLEARPQFNPKHLGKGAASFLGGRSEVRVRRCDVPVRVLDFTSMYPLIMLLQCLEALMHGTMRAKRMRVAEVKRLLTTLTRERLFDPSVWPLLNCLVLVEPRGAALPARIRPLRAERERLQLPDSYTIALTDLETGEARWYTLAEIVAALLHGERMPRIRRAICFVAGTQPQPQEVLFRGSVPLRGSFVRTLVEERQRAKAEAKAAKGDAKVAQDLGHLEAGLKTTANSIYGVFAEVNVTPHKQDVDLSGMVYSDITYLCKNVHDERPGAFSNPIIASLITGGARLMLALLECEVRARGGTFAYCDTDCLGVVCGDGCPHDVPCLSHTELEAIIARFDALNPYDPALVPHLLKDEYPELTDLRCFAVSAKRYVLYRLRRGRRIQIVKASESGLGAIIGRTRKETTPKLARRVWLATLMQELPKINARQHRRAKPLVAFDVPLRRKFPVSQPRILKRLEAYNRTRSYDQRVKPYGFVQTVVPATVTGTSNVLPIAPHEADVAKAKRLPWIDFNTGEPVRLDWGGKGLADTIPVLRMGEYIERYRRHPEWKAAGPDGKPAGEDTRGVLGRLAVRSERLARVGKEVDRLDQEEGASLEPHEPKEFEVGLAADVKFLASFAQEATAAEIGISVRRWRDIMKGKAVPREDTAEHIASVAASYRFTCDGEARPQNPRRVGRASAAEPISVHSLG